MHLSERLKGQRRNPLSAAAARDHSSSPEKGSQLRLVTNRPLTGRPRPSPSCYKRRWHIELFFKWIKQNLKIKSFLGTSLNAVTLQIITALIAYLLLHYAHRLTHDRPSRLRFRQIVQASLWQRRDLADLARPARPKPPPLPQLALAFP